MNTLVCVKRVPATGARVTLTPDEQAIDARYLSFAVGPHEECAIEAAVQIAEEHDGDVTVLTLGEADAVEQLRYALAMGAHEMVLLETEDDDSDWGPMATAAAIVDAIREQEAGGESFDVMLFGNDSADSGGYQVGVRVAYALGLPVVTGVKGLEISEGHATARREGSDGWEVYEVDLPAVFTVKEGINLPRYPSIPGKLRARRRKPETLSPARSEDGLEKIRLKIPETEKKQAQILGHGPEAAPKVVDILEELGLLTS
jgi:electron transfer flavoprotein beta subunit